MNKKFRTHYECGDGWKNIINKVIDYIDELNRDEEIAKDQVVIHQVKEKFGGLRIYCNYYPKDLNEIIQKAEDESYNTCEICGTKENVGHTCGYITSCCKDCIKELFKNTYRKRIIWECIIDGEKIMKEFFDNGMEKDYIQRIR